MSHTFEFDPGADALADAAANIKEQTPCGPQTLFVMTRDTQTIVVITSPGDRRGLNKPSPRRARTDPLDLPF